MRACECEPSSYCASWPSIAIATSGRASAASRQWRRPSRLRLRVRIAPNPLNRSGDLVVTGHAARIWRQCPDSGLSGAESFRCLLVTSHPPVRIVHISDESFHYKS